MRVLSADHGEGVDGVGVPRGGEGSFENGVGVARSCVPEEDLSGVGSSDNEVGVEGGEGNRKDVGLGRGASVSLQHGGLRGKGKRPTWEWKTNSGRSWRCRFHTQAIPSGSFTAIGFLL